MALLPFIKMHGLGNDFVVIDACGNSSHGVEKNFVITSSLAKKLCDRHFGIGADQILVIRNPSANAKQVIHAKMDIYNSDGSTAEMCGNGIRAVAVFLQKEGRLVETPEFGTPQIPLGEIRIETLGGIKTLSFVGEEVLVNMGEPVLGKRARCGGEELELANHSVIFFEIGFGNPHAVIFVENLLKVDAAKIGAEIESHSRFPKRTNVEFVEVVNSHSVKTVVWERGAGLTQACGSGACAIMVASVLAGHCKSPVLVKLPGGSLKMTFDKSVTMQGPALEVFRGDFPI